MTILFGLLPFLAWYLGITLLLRSPSLSSFFPSEVRIREVILVATVGTGVFTAASSEVLSLFAALAAVGVRLLWIALVGVLLWANWRCPQQARPGGENTPWTRTDVLLAAAGGLLLSGALLQSLCSPPNTPDSLSYHLPRQIYWLQQASLEHFYTQNPRQVMMPIFAEVCGTHLFLLAESDRLHNLVGLGCLGLAGMTVSAISAQLGATRTGQRFTAFLAIASPMAILEASNFKNDLMLGLWLCIFVYWTIRVAQSRELRWIDVLMLGGALGLGLHTKGTAVLFFAPVGVALAVVLWRAMPVALAKVLLLTLIPVFVHGPHLTRNMAAFGSPSGPGPEAGGYQLANERIDASAITSNALRNAAPYFALPSKAWNDLVFTAVGKTHEALGIPLNEPQFTYYHLRFENVTLNLWDDWSAASPIHVWLLLAAMGLLVGPRAPARNNCLWIVLSIACCYVAFSTWLKWQPIHQRLLLPLVLISTPVIGVQLAGVRARWVVPACTVLAAAFALPAFSSPLRPLYGPNSVFKTDHFVQLCTNNAELAKDIADASELVASQSPKTIGFLCRFSEMPEYAFMDWIRRRMKDAPPTFCHLPSRVITGKNYEPNELPDLLIVEMSVLAREYVDGRLQHFPFKEIGAFGHLRVFQPIR